MCELCGKETTETYRAVIEGTEMNLCSECARFGRVIGRASVKSEKKDSVKQGTPKKVNKVEIVEVVNPKAGRLIREKRERMGMNQEDFSKKLSIKESMLHKIETEEFLPSVELAKKIERILNIRIVEQVEERPEHVIGGQRESSELTIGDVIKISRKG